MSFYICPVKYPSSAMKKMSLKMPLILKKSKQLFVNKLENIDKMDIFLENVTY